MDDLLTCQISTLVKYRQKQKQNSLNLETKAVLHF